MNRVIVCFKQVVSEEDLIIEPDLSVNFSRAKVKISDYDRHAIEAARIAADSMASEAVGLTFTSQEAKTTIKDALARGLDQAFWIHDEACENADGFVTANVLAAAINKIGGYGLVICAEGAADTYAHEVGPRLGALLDLPVVSYVTSLQVEGEKLTAIRKLENSFEKVELDLPAVVTVLPEINPAPIPGLKAVLEGKKKQITELSLSDLDIQESDCKRKTTVDAFKGYTSDRKNVVFDEGSVEEKINALIVTLKKEGVL